MIWIVILGFGFIASQFFGETSKDLGFDQVHNISETIGQKAELIITDSIAQGKFKYEIYFAEFNGRMPNRTCDIEIKGNEITVSQDETTNLTGEKIIFKGIILKHKTGKWILANKKDFINSDEIGGCTEIPIIDFDKKLIEWC